MGIEPRKHTIPDADAVNMRGRQHERGDSASSRSVRRGRRPHGTSRNFMHENRETSETPAVPTDGRSAGEGSGRTARVHVCEESHCGVVPMNHSNNFRQLAARLVRTALPVLRFQATLHRSVVEDFAVTERTLPISTWKTSDQSDSSNPQCCNVLFA